MSRVTRVLVARGEQPVTDEVRAFLSHPKVEVLDSVGSRVFQVSLPEELAAEWSSRLAGWTLEREQVYAVPKPVFAAAPASAHRDDESPPTDKRGEPN